MSKPFRYYLRVRYSECDAQRVVFNARYGEYVDVGIVEFLRAVGHAAGLPDEHIDYQVVKQTVEWKGPARLDDVLELSIAATHIGNTSFTIGVQFRIAGEEEVIVTVETVGVYVDPVTIKKQPIPAVLRAALQKGAPGVQVDHAAYLVSQKVAGQAEALPLHSACR